LNFIGSAHFPDHVDTVNLTAAAQTKLAQINDPIFREIVRDYFLNTQFRRDIFGRGKLSITVQEQVQQLQVTRFALVIAPENIKFEHQFPLGEVKLQEEIYGPICTTLATGALTLGELQNHPQTQHIALNSLYQALLILIGIGYIHPAVNEVTRKQRQKSTDAFNMAVKTKALYSEEMNYLASPLIGTGVAVNRLEQLLLLAKSRKQSGPEFLWQVLSNQGKK
jgi:hypothetical protein